ncbi:MAG: hypothetical protein ACLFS0_08370 [Bacteroidales bacterium]
MTRIQPSQTKINHWYLVVSFVGQFMFVMSTNGLLRPLLRPDSPESYAPLWFLAILAITGIVVMIYGYRKAQENRFFIQWDDDKITWLLPGQTSEETLLIPDISDIEIKKFAVQITMHDNQTIALNLENFLYKDMQTAKKKMEEVKEKTLLKKLTYN